MNIYLTRVCRSLPVAASLLLLGCKKDPPPPPTPIYTVTFRQRITADGGPSVDLSVKSGEKVEPLKFRQPLTWQYVFDAWYGDNQTFRQEFDFTQPIKSDTILYAHWIEAAKIIFHQKHDDTGRWEPLAEALVGLNFTPSPLSPPPTRPYRAFKGWYADSTLQTPYPFEVPISSRNPIKVYAAWVGPGERWIKAEAPMFPDRYGHASAVFNDRLWVIGGRPQSASRPTNEVWSSANGLEWTQESPFSPRVDHAAVAFDGKLWVIGGNENDQGNKNDVWSSVDGKMWTMVATASFSPRSGHAAAVFGGKMWILGGKTDADYQNDAWSSADGITWTEQKPSSANDAFTPRAYHSVAIFNDRLWILGGRTSDMRGTFPRDIWSSADGIVWKQEAAAEAAAAVKSYGQAAVVFDGAMWILGGYRENSATYSNEVWSLTTTTARWVQQAPPGGMGDFTPRAYHTAEVFNNRIWIIGGQSASATSSGLIYTP